MLKNIIAHIVKIFFVKIKSWLKNTKKKRNFFLQTVYPFILSFSNIVI